MGHYGDLYDMERDRQNRERAERLAREEKARLARVAKQKVEFPDDPSKWEITTDERFKLLEDRVRQLENRNKRLK